MEQQALYWIAYDPYDNQYYDAIEASTPGVYRTLEAWGQDGATLELVSETEADHLLSGHFTPPINWRNPIGLIVNVLKFLFRMLIDIVMHPILTVQRIFIVVIVGLIFSYAWRCLIDYLPMSWL